MHIKYLTGEKIYLRPLELEDAEFFYQTCNNDMEVRRLTGTQNPFHKSQIESYILAQRDDRINFAIVRQEDHELVGEIVLNHIDSNSRSSGLRMMIADAFVGNGYGTDALRLALYYGFGYRNLHRIELEVYSINERAIHVYEKAGFKVEGVKRKNWYYNHQYYDSIMMSILEEEYQKLYGI